VQRRARFNDVPEKVAEKVPEKVLARSNKVAEGSEEGFGRCWCKASTRFRKVPEKVSEKVPERLGAEVGQAHRGFK
jgi:hypothetical protein